MTGERFTTSITVTGEQSLISTLELSCSLSRSELKRVLAGGGVWLKRGSGKPRRVRRATLLLNPGDHLDLYYDYELLRKRFSDPTLMVEKHWYSIWYKPAGIVSQGTKFSDHLSLLRIADKLFDRSYDLRLVHRLDREARGLIVLAHTKKSSARLSQQFRDGMVKKKYWAVVEGKLTPPLRTWSIEAKLDNKHSHTIVTNGHYSRDSDTTELVVELKTGRYHQIRRHLAASGHPLVGDYRYGRRSDAKKTLQLCAYELCFNDPETGTRCCYTLPASLSGFTDFSKTIVAPQEP